MIHPVFTMRQRIRSKKNAKIEEEGYKVVYEVAENIPLGEKERRIQAAFNMLFEIIDKETIRSKSPLNALDHSMDEIN